MYYSWYFFYSPDLPSEFQLPTGDAENINAEMDTSEINNFTGNYFVYKILCNIYLCLIITY